MNALAKQLNEIIEQGNPHILDMLSDIGKNVFFPKGILSQSAEAKQKAHKINATIGIAKEGGDIMAMPSVSSAIKDISLANSLTYAPSFGIPELRKKWQDEQREKNASLSGKTISLPVVTCGITHAVSIAADMWINPGDVVILPDKMWGNYNMIMGVRKGAVIKNFTLFTESGGFNLNAFENKLKEEAAKNSKLVVLLNFPQNPTGYTVTEAEGKRITDVLTNIAINGTHLIVIADDAYFGLFYEEDTMKESIFAKLADAHERILAVKLDGATKENYVWGLRVGFITYSTKIKGDSKPLYEALEKKTAGAIRGNISNASHLSQSIVLKSMNDHHYLEEKKAKFSILKKRANRVKEVVYDSKYQDYWDVYPFNSGYFMCIRLKDLDAEKVRLHLLDNYGVGLIALGEKDLRVAFSCIEESDVTELFDIIRKGIDDLRSA
ncbi:MAG: aminotransferase class I/II-fold pyridoxal phosphate-dependent enzyme [Proteobacteria bacterium]|nr:aminotransferase class I/II-fold pyridoxal phosphate-dependent enzyme [Pseudomonadota bacterium]